MNKRQKLEQEIDLLYKAMAPFYPLNASPPPEFTEANQRFQELQQELYNEIHKEDLDALKKTLKNTKPKKTADVKKNK